MKEGTLFSFEMLKEKFLLEKDFNRYLQMWYYVNKKMKNIMEPSTGLIDLFRKALSRVFEDHDLKDKQNYWSTEQLSLL